MWCVFEVSVSVDKTRAKPAPDGRFATSGVKQLAVEFFKRNAPNPPYLTQNSWVVCFRSFGRQNSCETRTRGPFWSLLERINLQLIFFETIALNPPRLTLNSCLVRFRSFGIGAQNSWKTRRRWPFFPLLERNNLQLNFLKLTHPIHPV